ncbi:hypothetical protein GGS23DRAFT_614986 [Durotheca rogersii]|uniref:uncharacterized protein n=1 Tax=Durotheca rogersii TaxID=419775 RepID=UPI00222035B7|nr:uncharacterized protein GGS23DRAFT_614986 [Durotheca rogersii]KAI5866515.1 hypothetical protein GGS23DRAFT_614986 [Durotheca rogersii]
MKSVLLLTFAVGLSHVAPAWAGAISIGQLIAKRAPKHIAVEYDCEKDNGRGGFETCNTMCFGLLCRSGNDKLEFDHPDDDTKAARRNSAGCSRNNRCGESPYGSGYECDEFPFAETTGGGSRFNRCVLSKGQKYQGGKIRAWRDAGKYCNKEKGCTISITLNRASNYRYCKPSPDCTNDGNLYDSNGKVKWPENKKSKRSTGAGYYRLRSGGITFSPTPLPIGTLVLRDVPINGTLDDEDGLVARPAILDYGAFEQDTQIVEDEVVGVLL